MDREIIFENDYSKTQKSTLKVAPYSFYDRARADDANCSNLRALT